MRISPRSAVRIHAPTTLSHPPRDSSEVLPPFVYGQGMARNRDVGTHAVVVELVVAVEQPHEAERDAQRANGVPNADKMNVALGDSRTHAVVVAAQTSVVEHVLLVFLFPGRDAPGQLQHVGGMIVPQVLLRTVPGAVGTNHDVRQTCFPQKNSSGNSTRRTTTCLVAKANGLLGS